ncbi:MAG: biotin--[acetyl-CoA-carboxylase] ligase [Kiritimatiellae bacterium]|nr:biotin--[acetyl-CoA-carboxylase] ligase [Kiritimatiellia bacterium]MDW8457932.1 biotin--[acetyl-CoA-carboxylase] ligase [Verrucomicrobiota bacterium]
MIRHRQNDPLTAETFKRALPGFQILVRPCLRSTQDFAISLLRSGQLRAPAIIVASRQTAGRGQRDNRWWSDRGSLCMTFVLSAIGEPPGQVPLRAGLGVAAALARWAPTAALSLKWPNDVLANGRKIAGILCERLEECDVIGIGINVNVRMQAMPTDVRRRSASLHQLTRRPVLRMSLAVDVARELMSALKRRDFFEEYCRWLIQLGRDVTVRTDDGVVAGRCQGIDDCGRLLLETDRGVIALSDSRAIVG